MVLPLPGALAQFSTAALKAISALDGITKSVGDVQKTVSDNIAAAATAAVTGPGSLFEAIPGFVSESSATFLGGMTQPPGLSTSLQQASLGAVYDDTRPGGPQVDSFIKNNVRLEDVLPSQQLFNISKNLGNTSMYADPIQAYTHVAGGSANIKGLCSEAESIISQIQADVAELLSVQLNINYSQFEAMGAEFFAGAQAKLGNVISGFGILCAQLDVRGKFESAAVAAFCAATDAFENFVTFANVKIQQFERLRKSIQEGLIRLAQLLAELIASMKAAAKLIPTYAASVEFGSLFRSLQKKVCAQATTDLKRIQSDVDAFSSTKADDRAKVMANFSWAGNLESIKAFVCGMQPATEVTNPAGEFAPLSAAFDTFSAVLTANDPSALFEVLLTQIPEFSASMATGVTNNNASDLSSSAASILGTLASVTVALVTVCASAVAFKTTFSAETGVNPARLAGSLDLYKKVGADNAKNVSLMNAGDTTAVPIAESTTPGQLAEAMKDRISEMPDGNERDQMAALHDEVQAEHRSTIISMDYQRRLDSASAFAVDEAEANRQLVNKVNKTYAGIDDGEYDRILTQ